MASSAFLANRNIFINGAQVVFSNGTTEAMRISSSSNVLIGTTSDSGEKLQVNGDIKLNEELKIYNSGTDYWGIQTDSNGKLEFDQNGTLRLEASSGEFDFKVPILGTSATFSGTVTADTYFQSSDTSAVLATASAGSVILRPNGAGSGTGAFTVGVSNTDISNNLRPTTNLGSSLGSSTKSFLYTYAYFLQSAGILQLGAGGAEKARITSGGNLLLGTTTDSGAKLYVNGVIRAVGGGIQAAQDYGFTLNDEAGNNRYGLKFGAAGTVGGSNLLMLTNRSLHSATGGGMVTIGGNNSTTGVSEVEIARFDPRVAATSGNQKKVTLDAVLELTQQTAPANPATGKSIIWMDSSDGAIKVKINYGGTVVTRTIALFSD